VKQYTLTLHNDVQEIPRLATFIEEIAENHAIDMATSMNLNLAMEEAVVNVMNYAYPKESVNNIDITAEVNDEEIAFSIADSGIPFDPTQKGEPNLTLDAEDRPIGGLGIHLVRQLMDTLDYRYENGHNILTLKKRIKK
jgi:anti-sigma regulatory factor (Ser/Thr protein kinase)